MPKTDLIMFDSTDRKYAKSRQFRLLLHDLQRFAERYGIDFTLFAEDCEDETGAEPDMSFTSSKDMFAGLGFKPGMENPKLLRSAGYQ